jgi:hypothetical protein
MQHHLKLWLLLVAGLLGLVAGVNFLVDPYGVFRLIDRDGFNRVKPSAGLHGPMTKAYEVLRVKPRSLILGNSRAEVGFDPASSAWPEADRPVFNLALPGTGTDATVHYLQHALESGRRDRMPRLVVWGVDFMDFLVDGSQPRYPVALHPEDLRLLTLHDGSRNPMRWLRQSRDYAESLLTLRAFLDSIATVCQQGDSHAADLDASGFNPMRDYAGHAANEGYQPLFKHRAMENTRAYLRRPKDLFHADGSISAALDDLRQVMRLCRREGIALHLVIYPYHAQLLEIFRLTGHWPAFESWKRALVNVVEDEAAATRQPPYPLWDFSAVNAWTSETIPAQGDRHTEMHWYWEAGHFKRELGDLMLRRILDAEQSHVTGFGERLSSANLRTNLARSGADLAAYRASHPQVTEELTALIEQHFP